MSRRVKADDWQLDMISWIRDSKRAELRERRRHVEVVRHGLQQRAAMGDKVHARLVSWTNKSLAITGELRKLERR